jgi:hypothetical protein
MADDVCCVSRSGETMEETRKPLPAKQTLLLILAPMLVTLRACGCICTSYMCGMCIQAEFSFTICFLEC